MKKLKFDVYIGSKMISGQSTEIKAIVVSKFFMPHGKYNLKGAELKHSSDCFKSLYDLGTYFADWIDLVGDEKLVSATIYLNIRSTNKVFVGREIINIIDRIGQNTNYELIRNFSEV